jgi:hypothetical protein
MLALTLSLLVCAAPPPADEAICLMPPVESPVSVLHRHRVQARGRRRVCASEGIKCDGAIPCCKNLKCVEEIVGKVCRSTRKDDF